MPFIVQLNTKNELAKVGEFIEFKKRLGYKENNPTEM